MKRRLSPAVRPRILSVPAALRPGYAALVRALLLLCLALTPLLFSVHLAEAFEEPKVVLFESVALAVTAVGLCALAERGAWGRLRDLLCLPLRDPIILGVVLF